MEELSQQGTEQVKDLVEILKQKVVNLQSSNQKKDTEITLWSKQVQQLENKVSTLNRTLHDLQQQTPTSNKQQQLTTPADKENSSPAVMVPVSKQQQAPHADYRSRKVLGQLQVEDPSAV